MSENWISFPNLGITFNLNPVAFTLGSTQVRWSLIFTIIAVAVGIWLYFKAIAKQNLDRKQVGIATAVTAFFALVGARLVFVIPSNLAAMDQIYYETGNYPDFGFYNTFYKVIAFFDKTYGGMNLFGGLLFGIIALAILCKIKKWPLTKYLDSAVYALPAAVAINALGYITGQSSFGKHSDSLLAINGNHIEEWVNVLRMNDIARGGAAIGPNVKWIVGNPVSPTPIYEILGCLAVILIIALISKHLLFIGEKFLWSLGLYSLVRAFTESSRIDATLFWNMRINVMFSVIAVVVSVVLIVIIRWQVKEGRLRNISQYVDARKNNGFENDVFVQKIYKGEAADVIPDTDPAVAPGESPNTNAIKNPDKTPDELPAETPDQRSAEPEQTGGKGQVWTADDTDDDTDPDKK